ncbi:hypothetical protein [Pseudonocardia sp. GCM10023141]|uniref:hypothetical protein n=1 Tax=Pseudonocardia sp. GCM10023141 TaxID=3252653 RepID=UPI0036093C01
MPEFDGDGGPPGGPGWHGPGPDWRGPGPGGPGGPGWHEGPGGPGWHGGPAAAWFGGPGWWPALPGLLVALLLVAVLVHATGVDRRLREWARTALLQRGDGHRAWHDAVERHGRTAQAFAAFECDRMAVLARPALADVSRPATARFVDSFAEVSALLTERYPGAEPADRFVVAVERCRRAWDAAVEAADAGAPLTGASRPSRG